MDTADIDAVVAEESKELYATPRYEAMEQEPGMWSVFDHEHNAWALVRKGQFLPHHRKDNRDVVMAAMMLNAGAWR